MRIKLMLLWYFTSCSSLSIINSKTLEIWNNNSEGYIYNLYTDGKIYELTDYLSSSYPEAGITVSSRQYGFYDDCNLPHIDSLKSEGKYYFEVSENDWDEYGDLEPSVLCGEMNLTKEENKELMTIYYSERQQWVTYEKLYRLPEGLEKYLAKEHPEVYQSYLEIKR